MRGRLVRWAVAAAIAGAGAFAVDHGLRGWQTTASIRLDPIELPAGWLALPVVAHLEDEHVDKSVDLLGEGHGEATHRARLGPFAVTWRDMLVKHSNAGEIGWSVRHSSLGSCRAEKKGLGYPYHPDTLRWDEQAGVYVLEWHAPDRSEAVLACRREAVVDAPAYARSPGFRLAVSVAAGLLVLAIFWRLRADQRGSGRFVVTPKERW